MNAPAPGLCSGAGLFPSPPHTGARFLPSGLDEPGCTVTMGKGGIAVPSVPVDRRRFRRVRAMILVRPATLVSRAKARRVNDISVGGLRAYSDEEQKVGAQVELELFFPDGGSATFPAEVVWVTPLEPGAPARFDIGLRFTDASAVHLRRISEVLGD